MEYVEIINRIVEAEQKAQEIANAAKEKRDHLSSDLQAEVGQMRESHLERARRRIKTVEEQSQTETRDQIARLELEVQAELAQVDAQASAHRDEWIDKLFHLVVNRTEA